MTDPDCSHPPEKLAEFDPSPIEIGSNPPDGTHEALGYCKCGAPVLVLLRIEGVKYDDKTIDSDHD